MIYHHPDNWLRVREAGANAMSTYYQLDCWRVWRQACESGLRAGQHQ